MVEGIKLLKFLRYLVIIILFVKDVIMILFDLFGFRIFECRYIFVCGVVVILKIFFVDGKFEKFVLFYF